MRKTLELEAVLKNNPQVNAEKLRESIELSEKLHKNGFTSRGYELPPPFARKRAEIMDNASDDPRVLRLRRG